MERRTNPFIGTGASTWRPRTEPEQAWARAAAARGEIQQVLPRIYAPPGPLTLQLKAAAVAHAHADAVIVGEAAAGLSWWPQLDPPVLTAARRHKGRPVAGFRWERRTIPDDLVVDRSGVRLASAALTVLDLIPVRGGNAIDEALRRRACTLRDLWHALELTPHRPGNGLRHTLLHDSRDQPWSEAERHLHRHYRACDLPFDYRTNHWVTLSDGRRTPLDFALPELRLAFEADGYAWHSDRSAFEYDRDRDFDLAAQNWQVVRISASFLDHRSPEVRRRISAIVRHRAEFLGVPWPTGRGGAR
ncbi:MAG TPA: hypothetical protein GXZ45_01600 [Propionibacterium sp.]|nr:hypothetical protein [Propionibacterium sp.]